MYADFTYYKDCYYGQQIADAEVFRTAAARASEYMDSVTFIQALLPADTFF